MMRTFVLHDEPRTRMLRAFIESNWLAFAQEGRPLAVTVEEYKAKRSGAQNRLYWALLRQIAEQAWVDGKQYADDIWHAFFAGRFIGWNELPGGGRTPISTTTLDVASFTEYIDRIQAYAATELGVETI